MVEIIKEACIGCGACHAINPEIFLMDDDGLGVANPEAVNDDNQHEVVEAIESCPTAAIVEK